MTMHLCFSLTPNPFIQKRKPKQHIFYCLINFAQIISGKTDLPKKFIENTLFSNNKILILESFDWLLHAPERVSKLLKLGSQSALKQWWISNVTLYFSALNAFSGGLFNKNWPFSSLVPAVVLQGLADLIFACTDTHADKIVLHSRLCMQNNMWIKQPLWALVSII